MRSKQAKIQAWLLLGIFAFFFCGNTLCLHTHIIEGNKIVHSHPYIPSSHHSHSTQALESIAGFNATLLAMQAADEIHCEPAQQPCHSIEQPRCTTQPDSVLIFHSAPRAPPCIA